MQAAIKQPQLWKSLFLPVEEKTDVKQTKQNVYEIKVKIMNEVKIVLRLKSKLSEEVQIMT